MIFFNLLGLGFVAVGFVAGWLCTTIGQAVFGQIEAVAEVGKTVGIIVAVGIDFWYRWTHHREEGRDRFFFPSTGGQIMFLPLWLIIVGIMSIGMIIEQPWRRW